MSVLDDYFSHLKKDTEDKYYVPEENFNDEDVEPKQAAEPVFDAETERKIRHTVQRALETGSNKLNQTMAVETVTVDEEWLEKIEDCLYSLEKIVRAPKTFIKEERELVNVEKAKRVDGVTLRHLSSHTEYVKQVTDEGRVIPKKVLARYMDVDTAIYENRVVKTVIVLLSRFIEEKHIAVKQLVESYDRSTLTMANDFNVGETKIRGELSIRISIPKERLGKVEENRKVLERLEEVRTRAIGLLDSKFMKELREAKLVVPPIQRTNLIRNNIDYNNCYQLLLYISSFNSLGYEVELQDKAVPIDDDYFSELSKVMTRGITAMMKNERIKRALYDGIGFRSLKKRRYRVVSRPVVIPIEADGRGVTKDDGINQYYFEKIKEQFSRVATQSSANTVEDIRGINVSFRRFFKGLQKINNAIYDDLLKILYPKELPKGSTKAKKKANIKRQEEIWKKYKLITKLKQEDLELQQKREQNQLDKLMLMKQQYEALLHREQIEERKKAERKREQERKKKEAAKNAKKIELLRKAREKAKEKERLAKEKEKLAKEKAAKKHRPTGTPAE